MSSPLKAVGHALETAGKDTVKALGDVISYGDKILKIVETAAELTPELKASISEVISDAEAVATAAGPAIASGGTNVAIDLSVVPGLTVAVIVLAKAVIALAPQLEAAEKAVAADVK